MERWVRPAAHTRVTISCKLALSKPNFTCMRPPIFGLKAGPEPAPGTAGTNRFEYLLGPPLTDEHRFELCKSGDPGEVTSTLGLSLLSYDSVDDVQEYQVNVPTVTQTHTHTVTDYTHNTYNI